MGHAPAVGVYHGHVPDVTAVVEEVVGQLVRGLVDLAVGEEALAAGRAGEGFDDACAVRELGGVGREYLVDCWGSQPGAGVAKEGSPPR